MKRVCCYVNNGQYAVIKKICDDENISVYALLKKALLKEIGWKK